MRRMTGEDAFADVLAANDDYAREFSLGGLEPRAQRGLCVLTCMDSRIEPLAMLGLRAGDAKILRNAGGRVTDDVIATLVVAAYLLGVERLMVVAHTKCRMNAPDDDALRAAIRDAGGPDTSDLTFGAAPDQVAALRADVARIRAEPRLAGLEVGGFVYDVDSGRLSQVA
jgi:carbonic anhydrase